MRNTTAVVLLSLLVLAAATIASAQLVAPGGDNTPAVGEPAPDFELPQGLGPQAGTLGKQDFAGKKVLLAFFPAAFTGG